MAAFVSELFSSIIQIVLFALIPFLWWLTAARRKVSFPGWIGLRWDRNKKHDQILVWIVCTIIGFWYMQYFILHYRKKYCLEGFC